MGSKNGPEKKLAKSWGIPYKSVPTGKLRRYFDLKNFTDMIRVPLGILKSIGIIAIFRPNVIFSKGGFASVPVILAAWILRKPVVIHDSDAIPGLTTKIASRFAKTICLGYVEAAEYFPKEKVKVTGIPLRKEIFSGGKKEGLDLTGFSASKPIILIMGGSLGAKRINEAIEKSLPELTKIAQIIHITGKGKRKKFTAGEAKGHLGRYKTFDYVGDELRHLYAISDLVISRAGANSIAEIQALRKPSLLIPLGKPVSHGDQIANARVLESRGGCEVILDEDLTAKNLTTTIQRLLKDESTLKRMSRKAYHPFNPKAAEKIAALLLHTK